MALYNAVNHDTSPMSVSIDLTLYIGLFRAVCVFPADPSEGSRAVALTGPRSTLLRRSPGGRSRRLARRSLCWFASCHWRGGGLRLRNPKTPYMLITVLLYGAIYFAIARYEPVYGAS